MDDSIVPLEAYKEIASTFLVFKLKGPFLTCTTKNVLTAAIKRKGKTQSINSFADIQGQRHAECWLKSKWPWLLHN